MQRAGSSKGGNHPEHSSWPLGSPWCHHNSLEALANTGLSDLPLLTVEHPQANAGTAEAGRGEDGTHGASTALRGGHRRLMVLNLRINMRGKWRIKSSK